jgi:hypothetical protein
MVALQSTTRKENRQGECFALWVCVDRSCNGSLSAVVGGTNHARLSIAHVTTLCASQRHLARPAMCTVLWMIRRPTFCPLQVCATRFFRRRALHRRRSGDHRADPPHALPGHFRPPRCVALDDDDACAAMSALVLQMWPRSCREPWSASCPLGSEVAWRACGGDSSRVS